MDSRNSYRVLLITLEREEQEVYIASLSKRQQIQNGEIVDTK